MIQHVIQTASGRFLQFVALARVSAWTTSGAAPSSPWDQPLNSFAAWMSGPAVEAFIAGSLVGSAILYGVIGNRGAAAKHLAKAEFGGALALAVVWLMNYLLP